MSVEGAESHMQPLVTAELAFPQRKMNAAQAWHEWMPIRDTATNLYAINRTLQFGACTSFRCITCNLTSAHTYEKPLS